MNAERADDSFLSDKVEYILQNADKKTIRKICGISPSQFLMLEISGSEKMKRFVYNKVKTMSAESFAKMIHTVGKK